MKILVPRITEATTRGDLQKFANRVLEKWIRMPFSDHPKIISCQILSIPDFVGMKQRHGLLEVMPDDAAVRIIHKLNGAFLCGKRVAVKQYDGAAARAIAGS